MANLASSKLVKKVYHGEEYSDWSKCVWDAGDRMLISYADLPENRWLQIEKAAVVMSAAKVGPKVYAVREGTPAEFERHRDAAVYAFSQIVKIIEVEKLSELERGRDYNIRNLVHGLHEAGLVHGNLWQTNVMMNDLLEPRIVNYDTVHAIGTASPETLINKLNTLDDCGYSLNDIEYVDNYMAKSLQILYAKEFKPRVNRAFFPPKTE